MSVDTRGVRNRRQLRYRDLDELLADAERIAAIFRAGGAAAKVSSIHVNAWFGDHDKCTTSRRYLQDCHGLDLAQQASSVVYVGDSPNDEPMFQAFPLSVGVANVEPHLPRMAHPPRFITPSAQAQGFVDLLELVGRSGPVALFLGQFDVGIVDVVVEPRFVDLFAFGLDFHGQVSKLG